MMELEDYINDAIQSFDNDPADSDFQFGYLAALEEIRNIYFPQK